ncbi:hypothetical protein AB0H12_13140 [Actinosynnema sp. NPDC023794]
MTRRTRPGRPWRCGTGRRSGLDAFVTYDKRLLEAAAGVGLPVAAPGSYDG